MGGFACMNTYILHVYTAQGGHKKALNSLGCCEQHVGARTLNLGQCS